MSLKCILGFHSWDGCKCTECEKTRDEQHNWTLDCEKCSNCNKIRENLHYWTKDCEKCSRCGKTRENFHDWSKDCEKCSKCGNVRENEHDWSKDCEKCSKCGKIKTDGHIFLNGFCSKCGVKEGVFIDERDGKQYEIVKIDKQTWLAENFAFKPLNGNFLMNVNDENGIKKNEFYYDWETAKKICPDGWRLPTIDDFKTLKARSNFSSLIYSGDSGFSAKKCGYVDTNGVLKKKDTHALFWCSEGGFADKGVMEFKTKVYGKQNAEKEDANIAWALVLDGNELSVTVDTYYHRKFGFSVRYIKNS